MAGPAPKTARCGKCANFRDGFCERRKRGRNRVHPGKPRRCTWFSQKA